MKQLSLLNSDLGMIIMFILVLLLGILLMHYVVIIWTCLNTPRLPYNAWTRVLPLILSLLFVGLMFSTRVSHGVFADILTPVLYIWLGSLFLWFTLVMATMAVQMTLIIFKIQPAFKLGPFILAAAAVISIISVINAARTPDVKIIEIKNSKITAPISIAQVTDTHLGDGVSAARLQKMFDRLAAHKPDLIVFTGDIFERRGRETQKFIDIIKAQNPRCGKYGVAGNHEFYSGLERSLQLWHESGITPLLNESADICGINVVGVNDIKAARVSRREFERVINESDTSKFTLLLSHTPLYHEEAAQDGVDLMLSGHTHNGQIWPFNKLVRLQFRHVYGMHEHGGLMHYVSSGAFYWGPPMRFLTKNEVPVFTIKPSPAVIASETK